MQLAMKAGYGISYYGRTHWMDERELFFSLDRFLRMVFIQSN